MQARMQKQKPVQAEACFFVSMETERNNGFRELGVYETLRGSVTEVCCETQQLILEDRILRFEDLCRLEIL